MCRVYLELLGDESEDQQQTVGLVLEELDRMARMVDALELLAEAEGTAFVRPEPIELELFTYELIAGASTLAAREWKLDKAAHGVLLADRQRLNEAMMQLARNAADHTHEGDTIGIGTSLDDDGARLWVRDAGPGVPESERARIFEPFARGAAGAGREPGSGLGLFIARRVVEAHGGRVWVESDGPGGGATFHVEVPVDGRVLQRPAS
jgi:signal transduction histidine kinase